ncbi:hypothetical protein J40TS1_06590 [Paenibacillus montaniterrae]|uniref:Lipoprotein n=1 Tax=Paenibacillus montaniterrae TaxID=429341 RepID=A0A919YIL1_9BACL|nr:hypothetical protein [Paenibacillus montaniterrae]GIP15017.1 hypothetical protein J40TS1_06590 [Paenibacillus montaniterrae]
MKRLLITALVILMLSACGNIETPAEAEKNLTKNKTTATPTPVMEDPDLLLFQARKHYEENDLTKVNEVLAKLKSNTPEAKEQIAFVKEMSDELTAIKKKEDAEKEKQRIAEVSAKLTNMRIKKDEVTETAYYFDKTSVKYVNENGFYIYAGIMKEYPPFLRLRIQYEGDNWLFIDKYIIKTDDDTFTIYTEFGDVNQDNGGAKVWEWLDIPITSENYEIIESILASEKTIIRHQGQYYYDRTLTNKEKTAIKNVMEAYEALGGADLSN